MVTKNVLFIVHDVYQDDNLLLLGVAYLAAVLEENEFSVEVYCMDVFHYTNDQLEEKLRDNEYGLICLGFLAARFRETVVDLCEVIVRNKKSAWFVLGGHGPSPIPEYMLATTKADIVVIGEGEETIVEVAQHKVDGRDDLSSIKGIAYRQNDNVFVNSRRPPVRKLDTLPFPAWHLFPMEIYTTCIHFPGTGKEDKVISMISSRGCINRCTFCYRLEKGIRLRSMGNVIEEIKALNKRYGVNVIHFSDELFVNSKSRVLEFADLLEKNDLQIKFTVAARADIFDKDIALALKRSGCIRMNVGFESSSQDVLNAMQKRTRVEDNINTLEIAQKVGVPTGMNFIWGFPNDTKGTLFDNMNIIKKYNQYAQVRTIRPVTPYPGCDLYYEALSKKLLDGPDDFFNKMQNSDLMTVNFTQYSNEQCYEWLFEVNRELVLDHFKNTNQDMDKAERMISGFKELYFGGDKTFRGARHYKRPVT